MASLWVRRSSCAPQWHLCGHDTGTQGRESGGRGRQLWEGAMQLAQLPTVVVFQRKVHKRLLKTRALSLKVIGNPSFFFQHQVLLGLGKRESDNKQTNKQTNKTSSYYQQIQALSCPKFSIVLIGNPNFLLPSSTIYW